jgi:hypothetical protein
VPDTTRVGKLNELAPDGIVTVSVPLASTKLPSVRPLTMPPNEKPAEHVTDTLITAAVMLPEPLATLQISPAGCVVTVTA